MRIVCPKCSAAYAIEDRLIGSSGVRAQCPRCKHQEFVKKPPVAANSPAPSAASGSNPVTPSASRGVSSPPAEMDFSSLGEDDGPPSNPLPPPLPPPLPAAKSAKTSASKASGGPTCTGCGKRLVDAFDQALGACDSCRNSRDPKDPAAADGADFNHLLQEAQGGLELDTSAPPASAKAPAAPKKAPEPFDWDAPLPAADPAPGAMDFGQDPGAAPDFSASLTDDLGFGEAAPPPAQPPRPSAPRTQVQPVPASRATAAATPRAVASQEILDRSAPLKIVESGGGHWKLIAAAVGGLLISALVAFLLLPQLRAPKKEPDAIPPEVAAVLPRWRLLFVDLSGTAATYLEEGRKRLAADEPLAYGEAEEAFQQALLQDPRSDDAIVGYVQALALGRKTEVDDDTFAEAEALIRAAEQRSQRSAPTLTAHANLLLARPHLDDNTAQARKLAEEAVERATPEQRADALLAQGRAYLQASAGLAAQYFSEALSGVKPPLSAYYYRALALEAQGEYRAAIEDLRRRLELTPGQADALEALARVYQECGDANNARTAYARARERYPEDLRFAVLHLAFAYQVDNDARLAAAGLRTLLKDGDRYDARVAALGFTHLATVERVLGNLEASDTAAQKALRYRPDSTGATLQLFLNALDRGNAAAARTAFTGLSGRTGIPGLESVLEGRLLMAEGKAQQASDVCRRGFEQDERRIDALICSGIAAVKAGRADDGYRLLHQAAQLEPTRSAPRPIVTRLFVRETDLLAPFTGILARPNDGTEDVRALLHEGVLRFRLGALREAESLLRKALAQDDTNAIAPAYLTFIAIARGDSSAAKLHGQKAATAGRRVGVARYANGEALTLLGMRDLAEREYADAIDSTPGLLAAEVALAKLEAARGGKDAARARLQRAIGRDPSYLPAKRALYALQGGD